MNETIPNNRFTFKDFLLAIKEWSTYLLSKWLIILVVGLAGGALGIIFSLMQKPDYTANLSFALEDQPKSSALSGALGLASQFGFDFGGGGGSLFASSNLIELFKSRNIIEQTLLSPVTIDNSTTSYAELFIDNAGWRQKWNQKAELKTLHFLPGSDRTKFNRTQDSIMGAIFLIITTNNLKVFQKDKKVDIITIEFHSSNELFAKIFTEALVKQVSDFYISTKSKKAKINMDILERQTDSVRKELNGAITGTAVANDNTFGLNPALNVQKVPSTKRQIDMQTNLAILSELVKQTEVARVALRNETPLIQVIDRPILPLKKDKLGKLMGIIIGGFLSGVFIVMLLIVRRIFRNLLSEANS